MPAVTCVFCHSSDETKDSGPMLHIVDGKPIVVDQALQSNVLHVHGICIEWTPRVHFVGNTAKNLEAEVLRASKIKCSKCGQKGAALGCFVKTCRRSFHVPCAVQILECWWDPDNFLLLCPAHISHKFPSDRSMTEKRVKNVHSSTIRSLTGATACGDWKPNVTHVIASTDELDSCRRTLKFFMAILSGKWVVRVDWIKACMEAGCPVAEEHYEINHDMYGCFRGPKNGRIRIMEKAPPLFSGLSFYFVGDFLPFYKRCLEDIIAAAGGRLLKEIYMSSDAEAMLPTSFVIYNRDHPKEGSRKDHVDVVKKRVEEAEALATKICFLAIPHTWLLDSIATCKLLPLPC